MELFVASRHSVTYKQRQEKQQQQQQQHPPPLQSIPINMNHILPPKQRPSSHDSPSPSPSHSMNKSSMIVDMFGYDKDTSPSASSSASSPTVIKELVVDDMMYEKEKDLLVDTLPSIIPQIHSHHHDSDSHVHGHSHSHSDTDSVSSGMMKGENVGFGLDLPCGHIRQSFWNVSCNCLFSYIPDEIMLFNVFTLLDQSTLSRVAQVCTRWRFLSTDRYLWQKIDLSRYAKRVDDTTFNMLLNRYVYIHSTGTGTGTYMHGIG
jgi:hypothetical protein